MWVRGEERATRRRAIRGAAAHCGFCFWSLCSEISQCWGTSAAHNPARRIAKLGASFGSSHRLRLPGSGRIRPISGPKGGCERGFGLEKASIRAKG